ncbi:MAG: aminodeoxychorismate/anthranilate synthase component II [Bacteroidales bacterium]|jgi:anthranilate synthase component 2|nr:aminodeoxychorismate/anthranilate synthase component II [Bacteroidales bacterium]
MKIFVVDNFDSFTFNLVHILEQSADKVQVKRNDLINIEELKEFDKIVFSPGPGLPSEVKIMYQIIEQYQSHKSILGVCLGHQAIGEFYGAQLKNMHEVNHGREIPTQIIHPDYIFNKVPEIFLSGRYHSWIVDHNHLPESIEITSIDPKGHIMSLRHKTFDIRGVQFHPESIMTEYGTRILKNWVLHSL